MSAIEPELIRRDVEALETALGEARYRHVAGIDACPDLSQCFARYPAAARRETVSALREKGAPALADWVATLYAERRAADEESRWREAESRARGLGPDGYLGVAAAAQALVRERDPERRRMLGSALTEAAEQAAEPRESWTEQWAKARVEVPAADSIGFSSADSDAFITATDDGYRDVLTWHAHREGGLAPAPAGDLDRADLLWLVAMGRQVGHFPSGMLELAARKLFERLGLELGQIKIDETERATKWPGAHVFGARISFSRQGGAADWLDLFRALGAAAAHRALRGLPLELRGRAAHATVGALLSGLLLEKRFLAEEIGIDRSASADVIRLLALRQLVSLRLAAASHLVADEVASGQSGEPWRQAYREAMRRAALAEWPAALASRDGRADAHAIRLIGATLARRFRIDLRERLDEDYWRNPRIKDAFGGLVLRAAEAKTQAGDTAALASALLSALG